MRRKYASALKELLSLIIAFLYVVYYFISDSFHLFYNVSTTCLRYSMVFVMMEWSHVLYLKLKVFYQMKIKKTARDFT